MGIFPGTWPQALGLAVGAVLAAGSVAAQIDPQHAPRGDRAAAVSAKPSAWSVDNPDVLADLGAGRPLVVRVLVPLCSNHQIWCGARFAGQPGHAKTNLYWGAIYGVRRFLERKRSAWSRVQLERGQGVVLERAVYRRRVPAARWGLGSTSSVQQVVVLEAIHGSHIDQAVEKLWSVATRGGQVRFVDATGPRTERVHVVGYAGHNRLMDGIPFPPALPPRAPGDHPVPVFVLACNSEGYFSPALRQAGSLPLVMTRSLMAPEGYVVDAVLRGLGDNLSAAGIRELAVRAYAKWQRLSVRQASVIFARR